MLSTVQEPPLTFLRASLSRIICQTYQESCPPAPGYHERRDLYNLYPLLNHLHLFGSAYYLTVTRILRRYA
ncbi:fructosamine kinase family protein [Mitsuokella jalaludinii]|uniref:fructosamine kinase family protein n=1 Tax=Mitsuokella jalaludinii TaxID=187979 RepID=UPI001D02305A|nr:fructosamine kinase family protein [Mitsuokella jalaludinii]MCB5725129.1 fructosamine kinase family protein [Mitsuokella jalaludinii]